MLAGQWQPPKKPQGRTHSYYPCHLKMSIGRKSPTDLRSVGTGPCHYPGKYTINV